MIAALLLASVVTCGVERWPEKILADPAAARLSPAPRRTTIAALNALPRACAHGEAARHWIEFRLYRVTGRVQLVRPERDGDLHIVLADGAGDTVIVESPAVACSRSSRFRTALVAARETCARFRPGDVVTVEGPAFYDFWHGQTGMARSCVEIHPVLFVRSHLIGGDE